MAKGIGYVVAIDATMRDRTRMTIDFIEETFPGATPDLPPNVIGHTVRVLFAKEPTQEQVQAWIDEHRIIGVSGDGMVDMVMQAFSRFYP